MPWTPDYHGIPADLVEEVAAAIHSKMTKFPDLYPLPDPNSTSMSLALAGRKYRKCAVAAIETVRQYTPDEALATVTPALDAHIEHSAPKLFELEPQDKGDAA